MFSNVRPELEELIRGTSNPALDLEDARTIVQQYVKMMTPSGSTTPPPLHYLLSFMDYVFKSVTQPVKDLVPELIRVNHTRLWDHIDFEGLGEFKTRMVVLRFAGRSFGHTAE
jgi:hypothetical protein